MLLYSPYQSPRLDYIVDFISKEMNLEPIRVTNSVEEFKAFEGARINYSAERLDKEIWIKPYKNFLFESGINQVEVECFNTNDHTAFFRTDGDTGFDILAASFYLLSRYEEYLPHSKDEYGRYSHLESIAHKAGFLDQPLVNIWIKNLKELIISKWPPAELQKNDRFTFIPTYDIDIAWSFRHKGLIRNLGGFTRSFFKGNFAEVSQRIRVLSGKEKDPFDVYDWLNTLHDKHGLKPYYFFLVAERIGKYDRNISPKNEALRELIRHHILHYPIGIHPSWRSGDETNLLQREIKTLTSITGQEVLSSRQHFIRFTMPETYRRLLHHDILFDFSMGYGTTNGFRASVASPFYWYDLPNEQQTGLMLFPFCFMDANSFYEQKQTPAEALAEMRRYFDAVKSVDGTLIMIWHNSFLGTDPLYKGWREVYEEFVSSINKGNM